MCGAFVRRILRPFFKIMIEEMIKKIRETEDFDESFLTTFCSEARQYYKTVSYQLDNIDEKWNKMYNDASAKNLKFV